MAIYPTPCIQPLTQSLLFILWDCFIYGSHSAICLLIALLVIHIELKCTTIKFLTYLAIDWDDTYSFKYIILKKCTTISNFLNDFWFKKIIKLPPFFLITQNHFSYNHSGICYTSIRYLKLKVNQVQSVVTSLISINK